MGIVKASTLNGQIALTFSTCYTTTQVLQQMAAKNSVDTQMYDWFFSNKMIAIDSLVAALCVEELLEKKTGFVLSSWEMFFSQSCLWAW